MDVAPRIAHWIMMISDGIRWYLMAFDCIWWHLIVFKMVFAGILRFDSIHWYSMADKFINGILLHFTLFCCNYLLFTLGCRKIGLSRFTRYWPMAHGEKWQISGMLIIIIRYWQMCHLGRGCCNRRCQNPGIARKGGGSDPCHDFLVELIKCTKAKFKW